jgi:hypothetical protein
MVFYRRERYISLFFALLGCVFLVVYLVLPAAEVTGQIQTARLLALACILAGTVYYVRNHIVVSDQGFELHYGFWRWGAAWSAVEALREVDLDGRKVRCLVLKEPLTPTVATRFIPRIHGRRYVELASRGPTSYIDGDRLTSELTRRIR